MRINLNMRSIGELEAIMKHFDIKVPTHMVQKIITELYKSIPHVEDKHEQRTQNQARSKAA